MIPPWANLADPIGVGRSDPFRPADSVHTRRTFTVGNSRADRIDAYLAAPQALRRAVAGMSRDQLVARPVAGKWSTLEVVCHVVDSDQISSHRMKRVIAEERPLLIGYNESLFTASLFYHDRDLDFELNLLDALRAQLAAVLRRLPDSAWSRDGVHNERGLLTLGDYLDGITDHVHHHARTIHEKRQALGMASAV
jgi:hypothetical protein